MFTVRILFKVPDFLQTFLRDIGECRDNRPGWTLNQEIIFLWVKKPRDTDNSVKIHIKTGDKSNVMDAEQR